MLKRSILRLYLHLFVVLFALWFGILLISAKEKQLANEPIGRSEGEVIDVYVE